MTTINLTTFIDAQVQTCFDLARKIDIHQLSAANTKDKIIEDRTTRLCEVGDIITWEAVHFGIKQKLTVKITRMEPFLYFEDEMVKGVFSSMKHKQQFEVHDRGTKMSDEFVFKAPLGFLGSILERIFLTKYLTNFLEARNRVIKALAEAR